MTLSIKSNISSLIVQKDLNQASKLQEVFLKRADIQSKSEEASSTVVSEPVNSTVNTKLNANSVAQDNIAVGFAVLATVKGDLDSISEKLDKMNILVSDTSNISLEDVENILNEIDSISVNSKFNEANLLDGSSKDMEFQVGVDLSDESKVVLSADLFKSSDSESLMGASKDYILTLLENGDSQGAKALVEESLKTVNEQTTNVLSKQSQLDFASAKLEVEYANIASSLSTLKDADIVDVSSDGIKSKILDDAAATLSSVANQTPSIAMNLI